MTERERFTKALKREPFVGHVPQFELVFYLTMEALGKVHPSHRNYEQWNQMSSHEKTLQMNDMADCYIDIAKKYHHSAILLHPNPGNYENTLRLIETVREKSGDEYFLMLHGDSTLAIPDGDDMVEFAASMYEEPEKLHKKSRSETDRMLEQAYKLSKFKGLLDGFCLCSDYCFNVNPFFSPSMFSEFITPYLKEVIEGYHNMGYYAIKHTDGNIMPIADQMVECKPDALHSLDPQGGVDMPLLIKRYGDRVSFAGNVNCGLLQTGTNEECEQDVRRSITEGMKAEGYIFATSNCAYTGLSLERYELMNKIWKEIAYYGQNDL